MKITTEQGKIGRLVRVVRYDKWKDVVDRKWERPISLRNVTKTSIFTQKCDKKKIRIEQDMLNRLARVARYDGCQERWQDEMTHFSQKSDKNDPF